MRHYRQGGTASAYVGKVKYFGTSWHIMVQYAMTHWHRILVQVGKISTVRFTTVVQYGRVG